MRKHFLIRFVQAFLNLRSLTNPCSASTSSRNGEHVKRQRRRSGGVSSSKHATYFSIQNYPPHAYMKIDKPSRAAMAVVAVLLSFVVCAVFAVATLFSADGQQLPIGVEDGKLDLIYEYEPLCSTTNDAC